MDASIRRTLFLALLAFGVSSVAPPARAATSDTMNVMVTPGNVGFGVTITSATAGVGYNFGSVNLGATTGSTAAIGVTNSGVISEYFVMSVSTTSGGTSNWVPLGSDGTPSVDQFELMGRFFASGSSQPADSAFVASDFIGGTLGAAGANTYNQVTTKTTVAETRDLWLKLRMPSGMSTSDTAQRTMVLTIAGQGI